MRVVRSLCMVLTFSFGVIFSWHPNSHNTAQHPGHFAVDSALATVAGDAGAAGDDGANGNGEDIPELFLARKDLVKLSLSNRVDKLLDQHVRGEKRVIVNGFPERASRALLQAASHLTQGSYVRSLLKSLEGVSDLEKRKKMIAAQLHIVNRYMGESLREMDRLKSILRADKKLDQNIVTQAISGKFVDTLGWSEKSRYAYAKLSGLRRYYNEQEHVRYFINWWRQNPQWGLEK